MMGTLDGKSQLYHLSTIMTITVVKAKKLRMKKNHRHSAEVTVIILLVAFLNPSFVLLQTWH